MFGINSRVYAKPANEMNGSLYKSDEERREDSGYGTVTDAIKDGVHGWILTVKLESNGRKVDRYARYGEVINPE